MIMERVNLHYQKAIEHYGKENVLGVFLYGSQNYGCDLENSDVDTKCILIPDLYHLAIKPYEVKHLHIPRENGDFEVCECMTLMHMVSNWKKQNPNFLEILYTDYYKLNTAYRYVWDEFVSYRESISHYDIGKGLKSIAGQALSALKEKQLSGKKVGNGVRLKHLLTAYKNGSFYEDCLRPPLETQELVKSLKSGATAIGSDAADELLQFFENIIKDNTEYPIRTEVERALDILILDTIQERFLLD